MKIIKNKKELAKLVDENKDLHLEDEDVRIEYQVEKGKLRDVYCRDLFLMNDDEEFDFTGRNFNGWNFNGRNFNGWNFTGRNFNGRNFNGWNFNGGDFNGWNFNGWNFNGWNFNGGDFNGWNFTGKKVSYYCFFNGYGKCKCESYEGRRDPHAEPNFLEGIEIIKPEEKVGNKVKIRLADNQVVEGEVVEE